MRSCADWATRIDPNGTELTRCLRLYAMRRALKRTGFPVLDFRPQERLVDALIRAGFATSKGAAIRLIKQGGVRVLDVRVTDADLVMEDLAFDLAGIRLTMIWRGKTDAVLVYGGRHPWSFYWSKFKQRLRL